jgi:hypothetical protein
MRWIALHIHDRDQPLTNRRVGSWVRYLHCLHVLSEQIKGQLRNGISQSNIQYNIGSQPWSYGVAGGSPPVPFTLIVLDIRT